LLEKRLVQEDPARFHSDSESGRDGLEIRGAGTTGMPLAVFYDRGALLANIAHGERERVVEHAFVGRRYRYRVLDLRGRRAVFGRVQDYYAEALFRPLRPKRRLVTLDVPSEEVLETIERVRPAVVRGNAAHLELIFRAAAGAGGLSHRPAAVVYAGDTMSAGARRLIEEDLGLPVLSVYGAVECFKIGFTCERRSGFHLHEDLVHVTLVDREGRRVAPGERGEIVVSNLVNRGTVLLNYRLGDIGRLSDEPCPCGRTSRRLLELEGRVEEIVELEDGTPVHPADVRSSFRLRDGILRFQLLQRERDRFELRVVIEENDDAERALAEAVAELRTLLHGARIDVVRAAKLEPPPGQKFRPIVPLETAVALELARARG
jgi:phenylacetate-CoA ligase